MLRNLALVFFIFPMIGLSAHASDSLKSEPLTHDESIQVDSLLKNLYQSFNYDADGEPDWELMQSVFVDGGQFVTEAPVGKAPSTQTVEAFISSWKASIRESAASRPAHSEWIIDTRIDKLDRLIRVDVVFQAEKSNDPSPRTAGLDSLVLVNAGGTWKILSFVVQYESRL